MQIVLMPRAQRQLDAALDWWSRNRKQAPDAFEENFERALRLIGTAPGAGLLVARQRRGVVRRLVLTEVQYFFYYRVRPNGDIEIISLWHTSRGSQPY